MKVQLATLLLYLSPLVSFRINYNQRRIISHHELFNSDPPPVSKPKEFDVYENEILFTDLKDTEEELALETFNELSLHTNSLSIQAFLEWEDIKDVLAKGFIDKETMDIIFKEVGMTQTC